jgi:hypothetical protein
MRVFICIAMAVVANSAQAQLRLPVAPLPVLPIQKLQTAVGQAGAGTLEQLSDVRHLLTASLIQANPRTIAADPRGNPIVRGEILAYAPSTQAIAAARANIRRSGSSPGCPTAAALDEHPQSAARLARSRSGRNL